CLEYDVEKIISGMPFNMNGSLGPQGEKTKKFIKALEKKIKYSDRISLNIELIEWDERLTSVAAERTMIQANLSREKRKKNIDKIASTFILQGYLDFYNGGKQNGTRT
ncbi:MAG: Holliday junction resolvase RuvX, partial [Clostridiales bacterium]|nr:Holliday junction resolvase RuvX [Clostridiales bacterium]